jgi:hypothetical protein
MIAQIFDALAKGLQLFDDVYKTHYQRKYVELLKVIREEEAKPIYGNLYKDKLRDQNKIDRAHSDIAMLLDNFLKDDKK